MATKLQIGDFKLDCEPVRQCLYCGAMGTDLDLVSPASHGNETQYGCRNVGECYARMHEVIEVPKEEAARLIS